MADMKEVEDIILKITDCIDRICDELTEIDSRLGDGDMGISMNRGADAVRHTVETFAGNDLKTLFLQCASALNKAAPSTMGTLLSGGLMALARHFTDKTAMTSEDIADIPGIISDAVILRGKAHVGDKTILDSMIPYAETLKMEYEKTGSLESAKKAALGAEKYVLQSTRGMTAKTGRASWLGERNKEFPDAGAYMFYRIVEIL